MYWSQLFTYWSQQISVHSVIGYSVLLILLNSQLKSVVIHSEEGIITQTLSPTWCALWRFYPHSTAVLSNPIVRNLGNDGGIGIQGEKQHVVGLQVTVYNHGWVEVSAVKCTGNLIKMWLHHNKFVVFLFFCFLFFLINLFIYLFIFGCVGSSFLCEGFL